MSELKCPKERVGNLTEGVQISCQKRCNSICFFLTFNLAYNLAYLVTFYLAVFAGKQVLHKSFSLTKILTWHVDLTFLLVCIVTLSLSQWVSRGKSLNFLGPPSFLVVGLKKSLKCSHWLNKSFLHSCWHLFWDVFLLVLESVCAQPDWLLFGSVGACLVLWFTITAGWCSGLWSEGTGQSWQVLQALPGRESNFWWHSI